VAFIYSRTQERRTRSAAEAAAADLLTDEGENR